jgi:hypothetical protein
MKTAQWKHVLSNIFEWTILCSHSIRVATILKKMAWLHFIKFPNAKRNTESCHLTISLYLTLHKRSMCWGYSPPRLHTALTPMTPLIPSCSFALSRLNYVSCHQLLHPKFVLLLLALQFLVPGREFNTNFIIMFGFVCESKTLIKITKAKK